MSQTSITKDDNNDDNETIGNSDWQRDEHSRCECGTYEQSAIQLNDQKTISNEKFLTRCDSINRNENFTVCSGETATASSTNFDPSFVSVACVNVRVHTRNVCVNGLA